jgi:signal transduction histidine kinase
LQASALKEIVLETSQINYLSGNWKFYWKETAAGIGKTNQSPLIIHIPDSWHDASIQQTGYGTYQLILKNPYPKSSILGLRIGQIGTSFRLYINKKLLCAAGNFAQSKETESPDYIPQTVYFESTADSIEILLEVSNFQYRVGGVWSDIEIGTESQIKQKSNLLLIGNTLILGVFLSMALLFFFLYLFNKSDQTSLFFVMICMGAALRICSTGEMLFRQMEIPIPFDILVKAEFISMQCMVFFGIMYIHHLFPRDSKSVITKLLSLINGICFLVFVWSPIEIGSVWMGYYLVLAGIQLLYLAYFLLKVYFKKRPYSIIVTGVCLLVVLLGINDILYSQQLLNTAYLVPYGILIFTFAQSFILINKFTRTGHKAALLSQKLINIKIRQEQVIIDKTQQIQVKTEELLMLNNIKDRIFSIVSHDLRSPLKSLATLLKFADDNELSRDDLAKYLKNIRKNIDSLNLTLENLLVWSTNQLNGVKSSIELIDIRSLVQDKITLYTPQAAEKELQIHNKINQRMLVYVDKHQLSFILRNLINNAIKFTDKNGNIELNANIVNEKYTLISVSDSGIGMQADAIGAIFNKSEIFSTYGTENEKGTGLGLMLCKEYIEHNGGQLNILSEPGKGTTIQFTVRNNEV